MKGERAAYRAVSQHCLLQVIFMPPTLKKLMGHIAFGACVDGCLRGWVCGSHFCTYCNF